MTFGNSGKICAKPISGSPCLGNYDSTQNLLSRFPGITCRLVATEVAEHLQKKGQVARTVTTKLRYADFSIRSRSTSLDVGIDDAAQIAEYHRIAATLDRSIPLYNVAGNHDVGQIPTPETLAQRASR